MSLTASFAGFLAAPIFRPVRRTRQARVVVIFQGYSLALVGVGGSGRA